jgi:hypothetical protein
MPDFIGAPERIRTADPQIRSLVLYPAELRAQIPLPETGPRKTGHSYRFDQPLASVEQGLIPLAHAACAAQARASFSMRMRWASSAAFANEKISANTGIPSASGTTAISSATIR